MLVRLGHYIAENGNIREPENIQPRDIDPVGDNKRLSETMPANPFRQPGNRPLTKTQNGRTLNFDLAGKVKHLQAP